MSGWARLGIILGIGFLLFVGCVAVVANMAGDTATSEDNPAVSEGVESEDAVGDVSQGVGSQDASGDVQLGTARNTDYDLSTVLPVKVTNLREAQRLLHRDRRRPARRLPDHNRLGARASVGARADHRRRGAVLG